MISATLATAPIGPFQLQAAIAAVHDEAASAEETDWTQILGLYELLNACTPGPMVTLNRIVALAMAHWPREGLAELATAEESLGGPGVPAAAQTLNVPEQRYLLRRAARV
ncbi:hypothetical protein [Actinokineospora sp.]|uniref:hypothetical protein n=1 Tax=Actinokineospora sp. TaxID=1872133 RepID=UPI003D69FE61